MNTYRRLSFFFIFTYTLLLCFYFYYYKISIKRREKFSIGYYPNHVTGLFTKLIGIASLVALCIIKNKYFISKI